MSSSQNVRLLLQQLQQELQAKNMWSALPPDDEAMNSTAPFCCDLMAFESWLQWLFIPRMQAIIDARATLPNSCAIQPMAEMAFREYSINTDSLVTLLGKLDNAINALDYDV
ncbi:hypothetical protein WH50_25210 [Pokkaliibacter plantistimulans]|uniref:YqcC-like domain-containing protein n=2 Tax=Pseudomonadota TaxID=1224 RepID=A0ABX5LR54_9GAMM|nr:MULTISPECIES: YqcC family protein [Pokkaliibacter]MDH2431606.1 YqcC family protein [Pokkaliibacter sp. MBI-7]PPC74823.1 hypothetical protein C4K68_24170 [Pokkaliibacter plantistimulans]PXF28649.1 hypothetical protein WH50_25210 [Pokkaliibacter plantistimulans]